MPRFSQDMTPTSKNIKTKVCGFRKSHTTKLTNCITHKNLMSFVIIYALRQYSPKPLYICR